MSRKVCVPGSLLARKNAAALTKDIKGGGVVQGVSVGIGGVGVSSVGGEVSSEGTSSMKEASDVGSGLFSTGVGKVRRFLAQSINRL
jgi:hypothetical protein